VGTDTLPPHVEQVPIVIDGVIRFFPLKSTRLLPKCHPLKQILFYRVFAYVNRQQGTLDNLEEVRQSSFVRFQTRDCNYNIYIRK
jgi:hypothetical protein